MRECEQPERPEISCRQVLTALAARRYFTSRGDLMPVGERVTMPE